MRTKFRAFWILFFCIGGILSLSVCKKKEDPDTIDKMKSSIILLIGVVFGLFTGIGLAAALILSGNDPFLGMNAGFFGLLINAFVTVGVSLKTKPAEWAPNTDYSRGK